MSKHYVKDENGFYYGITDEIFKSVLYGNDYELTNWFTEKLYGSIIEEYTILQTEMRTSNRKVKKKRLDILIMLNKKVICNIEVNSEHEEEDHLRNFSYASHLYSNYTKVGESYSKDTEVVLIDLTRGLPGIYKKEIEVMKMQSEDGIEYIRNFVIFVMNIDRIMHHWYNMDEEISKYAHIIMLLLNENELDKLIQNPKISKKDKEMIMKFKEGVVNMNSDKWWEYMTQEEDEKKWENTYINKGREVGLKDGHKAGIADAQKETITNMMKDNLPLETISKYVNLPLKKVKQIVSTIVL